MTPSRKILIDTDTASDDAIALIMALRSPDVSVLAITVVAGNVSAEQGTRNALFTTELCGSEVPVFTGAASPLQRPLEDASWFHGQDGLGDHGYQPAARVAEDESAVDAIVRIIQANRGIELITLGPLTNLALALRQWPQLAANVSRCVVMGGAPCCEGNVTPAAEYNFWVDPEAARAVLRSQLPIELVGWQLSRGAAVVNAQEIESILALRTKLRNSLSDRTTPPRGLIRARLGKRASTYRIPLRWPFCCIRPWRWLPQTTPWTYRWTTESREG